MNPRSLFGPVLLAIALAVTTVPALAQDATLDRARQMIAAKQAKEAFALLGPLEQQRAGDPEFDFLLGVAAIDAGEVTRGIFALERVLALQPDNVRARAEIARAYFLAKENETAKKEFAAVKRARPPAEVVATVDRFIDAIEARERAAGSGIAGYVEAVYGSDDNVNQATATRSFAIPSLGGLTFTLAPGAAKQRDDFWSVTGSLVGRYTLDPVLSLVGNASVEQRMNSQYSAFDTGSLNVGGGLSIKQDKKNEFVVAAQLQSFSVSDARFRQATGLVGQWRHKRSDNDQFTGYLQLTQLDYPSAGTRDANRFVLGGAWAHVYNAPRSPVSFAGVYVGEERTRANGVPHFGHKLWGGRIGGEIGITESWTLAANVSYEDRRYGGPDPLFLVNRHDKQTNAYLGATYRIDKSWTVTPHVSYTDTRSNVIVNSYDRTVIAVGMRYAFQ